MFGSLGGEFPLELGDGDSLPAVLHDELLTAYGSAFSRERGTDLWIHCYAEAMTLYGSWCASRSALAQHSPATATDLLPAWEDMLGLYSRGMAVGERQVKAAGKFARLGTDTTYHDIDNALREALGGEYVTIRLVDLATATVTVPNNSFPWGIVDGSSPWSSTVCKLYVELNPTALADNRLMERVGVVHEIIAPRLNAWATFDWYLLEGFILDDDHNLDVAAFDE